MLFFDIPQIVREFIQMWITSPTGMDFMCAKFFSIAA
jgi:hypothetical protein